MTAANIPTFSIGVIFLASLGSNWRCIAFCSVVGLLFLFDAPLSRPQSTINPGGLLGKLVRKDSVVFTKLSSNDFRNPRQGLHTTWFYNYPLLFYIVFMSFQFRGEPRDLTSVILNSALLQTQTHFSWICPYLFSRLLSAFSNWFLLPLALNPLFRNQLLDLRNKHHLDDRSLYNKAG